MRIHFYATLRPIVGGPSIELDLSQNATIRELIDELIRRFPLLAEPMLDEHGGLSRRIHVFVDGRGARHLEHGLDTRLSGNPRIDIFPAIAGG